MGSMYGGHTQALEDSNWVHPTFLQNTVPDFETIAALTGPTVPSLPLSWGISPNGMINDTDKGFQAKTFITVFTVAKLWKQTYLK